MRQGGLKYSPLFRTSPLIFANKFVLDFSETLSEKPEHMTVLWRLPTLMFPREMLLYFFFQFVTLDRYLW